MRFIRWRLGAQGRWYASTSCAPALTAWHLHSEEPMSARLTASNWLHAAASAMVEMPRPGQSGDAGFELIPKERLGKRYARQTIWRCLLPQPER